MSNLNFYIAAKINYDCYCRLFSLDIPFNEYGFRIPSNSILGRPLGGIYSRN